MSDRPIQAGDLVVVVKPHGTGPLAVHLDRDIGFRVSRLKRIKPPDELESEKRDEEVTA